MKQRIVLFWPGDGRDLPNQLALPNVTESTRQMEAALKKLGKEPYLLEGYLSKPHHAIERLGPIQDPMIGICVHWCYGPHTTEGVVGKDNPLLLASNFSGEWPGLVGLLNTGACLESLGRKFSRVWTEAEDWTTDDRRPARPALQIRPVAFFATEDSHGAAPRLQCLPVREGGCGWGVWSLLPVQRLLTLGSHPKKYGRGFQSADL